jgi:hypothetical protein
MVVWILIAVGAVALFGLAWWSSGRAPGGAGGLWWLRRRGSRRIEMNTDHQRAKGQAYLQGQHTRSNIGDPFH